jgi:uncharacterized membrane protein
MSWQVAALAAWDTTSLVLLVWVWVVVWTKDAEGTAAIATSEDDSRGAADIILVGASITSLAGVGLALVKSAAQKGAGEAATIAVAVVSVLISWAVVHTVFTLHYARLYHAEGGGVDFHGDQPDYRDFAYLALTIGMTYQVSDTDLSSKAIRRTALHHGLLGYMFGTVIIAMTINVVASLLK